MQFNPPPNWPPAPQGWRPSANWRPDPSWPDPPAGWQLWIPEQSGPHHAMDDAPQEQPGRVAGVEAEFTGFDGARPTPSSSATAPDGSTRTASAAAAAYRTRAVRLFWVGAAAFAFGALTAMMAADGGIIWTGGLIVGVSMTTRAVLSYRRSLRLGGPRLRPLGWMVSVLVLALCAAAGVMAVIDDTRADDAATTSTSVGSRWQSGSAHKIAVVPCSDRADYKATAEVTNPNDCPPTATTYVDASHDRYLCLAHR